MATAELDVRRVTELVYVFLEISRCRSVTCFEYHFFCIGMMRREEHAKRPGFVASMKKLDRRRKPEVNRVTRRDLRALNMQKCRYKNRRFAIEFKGKPTAKINRPLILW